MAVASLVLGIISMASILVFDWWTWGIIGLITGAIAIVLGALGKKDAEKAKLAHLGFIFGIIGAAFGFVFLVGCSIWCAAFADDFASAAAAAAYSNSWY